MSDVDPNGRPGQAALRLADATHALLAAVPVAAPFFAALAEPRLARPSEPAGLPVLRWLRNAAQVAPPATARLAGLLADLAGWLAWRQSYTAAEFGPDFLQRYGWTELIGTSGPIANEAAAFGFLILGPHTLYPSHAHEAEELYLPLAGTAWWQRGREAPAPVPPGTPIHHPSWLPHAMRTEAEPLVALYCWRGGPLSAKPLVLDQA